MRAWIITVFLLLGACSGGGSEGIAYCYSDGPIVSNLVVTPATAVVGEGGGTVVVNATLDYRWRDSWKIIIVEYRVEDAAGNRTANGDFHENLKKSGSYSFTIPMQTNRAQMYVVRVRAMDECFEPSKWVETNFEVAAVAAVADKTAYATARLDNTVYFAGGQGEDGQASNVLLQYDAASQQVEVKAPMPEGREFAAAAAHEGVIYVFGGTAYGLAQDSTFAYDVQEDSWRSVAPMSLPVANATAIAVEGIIYVEGAGAGVQSYDPLLDLWTSFAD